MQKEWETFGSFENWSQFLNYSQYLFSTAQKMSVIAENLLAHPEKRGGTCFPFSLAGYVIGLNPLQDRMVLEAKFNDPALFAIQLPVRPAAAEMSLLLISPTHNSGKK